jgi:hypothetical protein
MRRAAADGIAEPKAYSPYLRLIFLQNPARRQLDFARLNECLYLSMAYLALDTLLALAMCRPERANLLSSFRFQMSSLIRDSCTLFITNPHLGNDGESASAVMSNEAI